MSPQLPDIERRALCLPAKDRETLAERLMQSLENSPLNQVEEAWVKEAERRFTAWRAGRRKGIPAAQAIRRLRKDLDL